MDVKQGMMPANDDRTKEDSLFLSALQNEAYRKEILEILYEQERIK